MFYMFGASVVCGVLMSICFSLPEWISLKHIQLGLSTRQLNAFVLLMHVCISYIIFSFFSSMLSDWLGEYEWNGLIVTTPCPEKNGTNNFDKYKCLVVILAWNVVKVMQNQSNTTKVRRT